VHTGRLTILSAGLAVALALSAIATENFNGSGSAPLELAEPIAKVRSLFPDVPHIDTDTVRRMTSADKGAEVQLVDVREPNEFAVSHIPGAINVPLGTTEGELLSIVRSDIPVIIYCSVGHRSAIITRRLQSSGRKNVQNYVGSFFSWANSGNPMQSARGPEHTVHPYDRRWSRYLRRELRAEF
jgi:rhodanese-related sulfurtransferase